MPQGKLEANMINGEENLILRLNNMNKIEKDNCKTSYVNYKLFKHDAYGLALEDTGLIDYRLFLYALLLAS